VRNWAGNVEFGASDVARPRSVEELQDVVATCAAAGRRVRALGTAHSFSPVADTEGVRIFTDELRRVVTLDGSTVTVEAGIRYADLAPILQSRGLALHNLPSLPHLSVAGALATATHGSGDGNGNLSTAIEALELVDPAGEIVVVDRRHPLWAAAGVGLGAFGVVARAALRVEPTFDVAQTVHLDVPFESGVGQLDAILASAYSVSLFTDWTGDRFHQVWRKRRIVATTDAPTDPATTTIDGSFGTPTMGNVHPLPGLDAGACTEQLGIPGPWHERLPHFRADATPSAGAELQSEYFVDRRDAPAALRALHELAPLLCPLVLVTEVRSVAADALWMSPAFERDSVAIHFTWRLEPHAVMALLPRIEATLDEFAPRPHWGKLTAMAAATIRARYPRFDDFAHHRDRLDPGGTFGSPYLDELLGRRPPA
jgi:alditol oxidase